MYACLVVVINTHTWQERAKRWRALRIFSKITKIKKIKKLTKQ